MVIFALTLSDTVTVYFGRDIVENPCSLVAVKVVPRALPNAIVGAIKSKATDSTVMLKLELPVFPAASVAVHVTVVVPVYHLLPAKFRDEGLKLVTSR